jgi:uncharacterized protein DUF4157
LFPFNIKSAIIRHPEVIMERRRIARAGKKADDTIARARLHPSSNSRVGSHPVLQLQEALGNRAVGRLLGSRGVQAKLTMGQPGDRYEREADQVATAVMRMPESQITGETEEKLQQQPRDEEEKVRRQPVEKDEEKLRMKPMEEDKEEVTLQAKEAPGHTPKVRAGLASRIQALRGGGRPLPESVRAFFEHRFGYDFSNVRVHTGADAADLARSINARAFTVGRDIVFGANEYAPQHSMGRQLLAHELMHVVQQGAARGIKSVGPASASSARAADTTGRPSEQVVLFSSAIPQTVQRAPDQQPQLLRDFAAKFPDAAALLCKSPEAMQLVHEAAAEGVKFGGYAEDGPEQSSLPYTIASTKTIYVPKGRDKIGASSDFLCELNNALCSHKPAQPEH